MPRQMPKPQFIEVGRATVQDSVQAPVKAMPPTELGWQRVEEFLQVRELAENSKKAYVRQLRQF